MSRYDERGGSIGGWFVFASIAIFVCFLIGGIWCLYLVTREQEKTPAEPVPEVVVVEAVDAVSTLPPIEKITDDMPLDDKTICTYIVTMVRLKRVVDGIGDFRKLEGLKWSIPLKEPVLTLNEIIRSSELRLDEAMAKRYPPQEVEKRRQIIREEAVRRYQMFAIGEKVKLVLRNGVGTNATAEGTLTQVTSDRIMLDGRLIYRGDISVDDQGRIFQDAHEKCIKEYCYRREAVLVGDIQLARSEVLRQIQAERFVANGYIPDILKQSAGLDNGNSRLWISRRELVERIIQLEEAKRAQ